MFNNLVEKEDMKVTYVDQFNKELWQNHTTIEPTQKMKEFKKSK